MKEISNIYYFIRGKIYFSKAAFTRQLFMSDVVFHETEHGFYKIVKNRYDHEHLTFMTRKAAIDYVQSLFEKAASKNSLIDAGNKIIICTPIEATYDKVSEDSPIEILKPRGFHRETD